MTQIFERTVKTAEGELQVVASYDSRLRRNVRWMVRDNTIQIRAPRSIRRADLDRMVADIVDRVQKQRRRAVRMQAVDLQERAEAINRRYFGGELAWHTIRWVTNMEKRLGSCTTGGSTDGDIRISERIRNWPTYVVDYVIAHELAHRRHADHSPAFWDYLTRYPHTERARGFIEGMAFAEETDADSML